MKTGRKAMLVALCAVLLMTAGIISTLAYFTDTDSVTNTFTVGKVQITLDEADVDENGVKENENRVKENQYHLIPGSTYLKDPTVHVEADSEDAWLFVEILNEIKEVEAGSGNGYTSIEEQIGDNGWTLLEGAGEGAAKVYYLAHAKTDSQKDYPVFKEFKIDGSKAVLSGGDGTNTFNIPDFGKAVVTVKGYAIQKAGFETAAEAWTALQAQIDP